LPTELMVRRSTTVPSAF